MAVFSLRNFTKLSSTRVEGEEIVSYYLDRREAWEMNDGVEDATMCTGVSRAEEGWNLTCVRRVWRSRGMGVRGRAPAFVGRERMCIPIWLRRRSGGPEM